MTKPKRSPSRIKYEQSHPTVSARIPVAARDKLIATLKKADISLSDALLILADELEIKLIPVEEARKTSYKEAKNLYMVAYPCYICGRPIAITSLKEKEVASKFMTENGWGHAKCHEQVNNK